MKTKEQSPEKPTPISSNSVPADKKERPPEYGGPQGLEPTRYGDWEQRGKCVDF